MTFRRRQGAAEVAALIRGFREKDPKLSQIYKGLVGDERPDYEEFQDILEESNARVDPEVRKKQIEERQKSLRAA